MTNSGFQTTCWTQVMGAADRGATGDARPQLESLCVRYWYPLYAYLRRRGFEAATAEDLVQGFFAYLLEHDRLKAADPSRGKFRSFLLTACKNFVANQQRSQRALRRGGDRQILSLASRDGEERYAAEAATEWTAERLFDRRWALETIDAALALLESRYEARGRQDRFVALRPLIAPAEAAPSMNQIAEQLGISENAVKVAAHRLREQFAAALRELVADTVDLKAAGSGAQDTVDAELAELLSALRGESASAK